MGGLIAGVYEDWISLDERIDTITSEIEKISEKEATCQRLMSVPGIGPAWTWKTDLAMTRSRSVRSGDRDRKLKESTLRFTRDRPQPPPVRFDDRAADR
jgi:hypothetical protein